MEVIYITNIYITFVGTNNLTNSPARQHRRHSKHNQSNDFMNTIWYPHYSTLRATTTKRQRTILVETMISRRDKLLIHPWEQRRFEQHREKVKSAKAAIDRSPPICYPHIVQKAKKQQSERERTLHVEAENVRLLQSLSDIMRNKRMPDFWREPRPNFLAREKLFEIRPKSTYLNWSPLESLKDCNSVSPKRPNSRCPTCNGRPEQKMTIIPEARIPWQPPRITFNKRLLSSCYIPSKLNSRQKKEK